MRSGMQVALKIIDPQVFKSREVQQELEILRYFGEPRNRHPNVCGLISIAHDVNMESKNGPKSSYLRKNVSVIVTEYASAGDLFSYLSGGIPFNETTCRAVFQQVVRGLHHLHRKGVVHLDIKPENILLGKNGIVKIADFGMSEVVKPLNGKHRSKGSRRLSMTSTIHSTTSLQSLESKTDNGSPLTNFFPTNDTCVPEPPVYCEEIDDDALFDAITSGTTRSRNNGIRVSSSTGNLESLGMGLKSKSYDSISSLDSFESLNSRYSSPKLVVNSRNGTLCYQAPEVSKGHYDGAKADVFSLGVVLHVMLYGVLPYSEGEWNRSRDFYEYVKSLSDEEQTRADEDYWKQNLTEWREPSCVHTECPVSEAAQDLLQGMLCLSASLRFSLKDVMKHPWVEASQVRGSVQVVAMLVKRREPYVKDCIIKQSMQRKARKRGYSPSLSSEFKM